MVVESCRGRLGFRLIADNHMLGYACLRLPIKTRISGLPLTHSPCSFSHSSTIQRYSSLSPSSSSSSVVLSVFQRSQREGCCHLSNLRRKHHHSSSCNGNGFVGASIWHALLPSSHFSDTQKRFNDTPKSINGTQKRTPFRVYGSDGDGPCLKSEARCDLVNCTRFSGSGFSEGSWNATWDVRPARWLHGSHSAWLLFGVCACFSGANGVQAEAEALAPDGGNDTLDDYVEDNNDVIVGGVDKASHGKKVYTDYSVRGIPGDGRCLFRAITHGACLRNGKPVPTESLQRELADELRDKVADELIKRREESEWFIEGDFDTYVEQIRKPHVWGGEPELIMASHVLQMPITVYIHDRGSDGLIAIAEYGQDYGKVNPIRVLFNGYGHYEALQIHND